MNWYVEAVPSSGAPTDAILRPTPGFQTRFTVPTTTVRASWAMAGRAFVIVGAHLYEHYADGSYLLRGTLAQDPYLATISYNGTAGGQLFITSAGNGYLYILSNNTLTEVLTGEATQGGMINSRFLAFNRANGRVRMSALNDGLTWNSTLYFARGQAPDPWQAMVVNPPEIWMIGEQTGEVWYDTGAFPQPFAPIPGAFFKYGTPATFSAGIVGNVVMWLARAAGGAGSIVAARGYTPQPISDFAVETAIGDFTTLSDCELLSYEQDRHQFGCWSFPTERATWAFDFTMQAWAERGTWDGALGRYEAWSPRVLGYVFGHHLVGFRDSGVIAVMGPSHGSEANGDPIRRLRIPPPIWAQPGQRLVINRFELMVDTGLGLTSGTGSNPSVMLRVSKNGKTWGNERTASAGQQGDYGRRVVFHRCGSSDRLWLPEIVVSDPVPWRIAGARIEGQGIQAQARSAA